MDISEIIVRQSFWLLIAVSLFLLSTPTAAGPESTKWAANIQLVLDNTKPLVFDRQKRLPLYLWPGRDPGPLTETQAIELVRLLDERGIGLLCRWKPHQLEDSLRIALPVARAQKKLGLKINIEATKCHYRFFNGDPKTAHIDEDGVSFDYVINPNVVTPVSVTGRNHLS